MKFDILTIFPNIIDSYANASILGRAQKKKKVKITAHDFRKYSKDKHGKVDDKPFGGGPGMILQVQPIFDCLKKIKAINKKSKIENRKSKIIVMDPAGKKFNQRMAEKFSKLDRLVIISGRYEGFDARVYKLADERVSVGDYVLAGGELPALVITEAVARLVPGVLGNPDSLLEETFANKELGIRNKGLNKKKPNSSFLIHNSNKEYPQYSRPETFNGWKVPKVLLSGDHKKIQEWRNKNSF